MPIIRKGDFDKIMELFEDGMSVNSLCPFPYNQPLLNYLIMYGRENNPVGAAKTMQFAIENGADVNRGAKNGVCQNIRGIRRSTYLICDNVQISGVLWLVTAHRLPNICIPIPLPYSRSEYIIPF